MSEPSIGAQPRFRHLLWRPSGWTGLSRADTVVTGRSQQFLLHATPNSRQAPTMDCIR
jgi:hypothetical protein